MGTCIADADAGSAEEEADGHSGGAEVEARGRIRFECGILYRWRWLVLWDLVLEY